MAKHPAKIPDTSVSRRLLRPLLRAAERVGIGRAELLEAAGLPPDAARATFDHVTAAAMDRALALAVARSGDPGFGFRVGAAARETDLGLWIYLAATSPSVREGLSAAARYLELLHGATKLELLEDDDGARLSLRTSQGSPLWPDLWLSLLLHVLLPALHVKNPRGVSALRVALPEGASSAAPHFRALGLSVELGGNAHVLELARHALGLPLLRADREVHATLARGAQAKLARIDARATWTIRVRQQIHARLGKPHTDLPSIARSLGVSRATLTRRLSAEGTGFSDLRDDVRAAVARRHLGEGQLSMDEIAFALGFANTAAFYRAFRRWTQESPGRYRRREMSQPG